VRVFVYEYTCATNRVDVESLRLEGWAMLSAVAQDFTRVPGVQTVGLLDERFEHELPGCECRRVTAGNEESQFRQLARSADYSLIIAPEFDDLLGTRCQWVQEEGGGLLGPSVDAVRLTGDKWALAQVWFLQGVPTPQILSTQYSTLSAQSANNPPRAPNDFPLVLKPRYGAGSQATFLVRNSDELSRCRRLAESQWAGELILQAVVRGLPVSVAFLLSKEQTLALPPARQHLSEDGRFHYQGGALPLQPHLARRAESIARRAVTNIPDLRGYVGVDVVLGETADWAIEINPRLTTSYIGLRTLTDTNLAEILLRLAQDEQVPQPTWRNEQVRFGVDGTVSVYL
jgi:predicted ATP-grasp superfamily ATP-dependent carboligase